MQSLQPDSSEQMSNDIASVTSIADHAADVAAMLCLYCMFADLWSQNNTLYHSCRQLPLMRPFHFQQLCIYLHQHKPQKLPCHAKISITDAAALLAWYWQAKGVCCNLGDVSLQDAAAGEVHTLPDGQSITIEGEGQQLAQALLNPSLLGKDLSDLPSATVTQIMQHPDGPTRKVFISKLDIVSADYFRCWTLLA